MSAIGSCPERQLPLQNYGKPTFVQPTAKGQLLCSIGKGRYGGKVVVSLSPVSTNGTDLRL